MKARTLTLLHPAPRLILPPATEGAAARSLATLCAISPRRELSAISEDRVPGRINSTTPDGAANRVHVRHTRTGDRVAISLRFRQP
ncbi:MAG: hypothetical protein JJ896_11270 [Rhodothermales bacterium]|nr:hypothetical protein [Rhodothermales bacterium]MBO6780222.1 hypothetical protein [Rhodothermales bacterium]